MQKKIKSTGNDLKMGEYPLPLSPFNKRWQNEFRKDSFCSVDGNSSAAERVSKMRPKISRRLQGSEIFMLGPVSDDVICTTHLQGKPARHRNMSERPEKEALPYGYKLRSSTEHNCICERDEGLEDLCGLRKLSHPGGSATICRRRNRCCPERHCICAGLHDNRSFHRSFSLGEIQKNQGRSENAYLAGSSWAYPFFHRHNRRKGSRCKHSGRTSHRDRSFLYHGSGISGLCKAFQVGTELLFFCNPIKTGFSIRQNQLQVRGQNNWPQMRSDNSAERFLSQEVISFPSEKGQVFRQGRRSPADFSVQQFLPASNSDRRALSVQMANRAFLQVDKATSSDQGILRDLPECSKNSNMDCSVHIRNSGNHEKEARSGI